MVTLHRRDQKKIAVVHAEAKNGCTCCITTHGNGGMEPMQIIATGKTHVALDKFKKHNPAHWTRAGGETTEYEEEGVKCLSLDSVPSYRHRDGHMLCAGNNTHWINAATLRVWVRDVRVPPPLLVDHLLLHRSARIWVKQQVACRLCGSCTFNAQGIRGKSEALCT